ESIFVVVNNKASDLVFTSPIDSSSITLPGFNYVSYVRNNDTSAFGTLKGISAFMDRNGADPGFGTMSRFGIGTSSNGHQGTFALDNVRVVPEVSFNTVITPPLMAGDTDGDGDVDMDDFEPIRANFRKSVTLRSQGDLVRNNTVDFDDFRQWKTAFLGGGSSLAGIDLGFTSNVPEPSTIGLIVAALAAALTRRTRGRTADVASGVRTHA
ncbi:MAG TPA: PEP-CTERM sorting domain-containing protein, partial [Lacipirellulaceae bacterium]|nr:PEP-CTERM sorting domain-containing protein [Lacipirellulaceae bacterium]